MEISQQEYDLLIDELNKYRFNEYLDQIQKDESAYFEDQDRKYVRDYFNIIQGSRPPSVRLREVSNSRLREDLRLRIIAKYNDLFGATADYQVI